MPLAGSLLLILKILDVSGSSLLHPPLPAVLESLLGKKIRFEGRILEPPVVRGHGSRVGVKIEEAEGTPLEAKVLLTLAFVPPWERGDRISFETRLKRPRRYGIPGSFDYRRYLEREGIVATGFISSTGQADIKKRSGGLPFFGWIDSLRHRMDETLRRELPLQEAGFLAALVLGDQSSLSEDLWGSFRRTGTAHLVAISGQHIGMIAAVSFFIFLWILKRSERLMLTVSVRKVAAVLSLFPIFGYILLAGAPPSAVRAAIVSLFFVGALIGGRDTDPFSVLGGAAILIGLLKPSSVFSLSFQLSFLAVLGILFFRPRPGTRLRVAEVVPEGESRRVLPPRTGKAGGNFYKYLLLPFWITVGATVWTAPLIAGRFHEVSLSGVLTNLWAVPYAGTLLVITGFSLLLSLIPGPLGVWAMTLSGKWASLFLMAIKASADRSWVVSFYPTGTEVALGFGLVFCVTFLRRRIDLWRPLGCVLILLLAILLFPTQWARGLFPRRLEVTFLDVGQGDAALIVAPSGKTLLIDGGGFLIPGQGPPLFDIGSEVLVPYLKRRGIRRIDRILLSHPHPDHYGGLRAVVSEFPVGAFWHNGGNFPDETFEELRETLQTKRVPVEILKAGEIVAWEGLQLEVLYPDRIDFSRSINDNSLVICLTYGETRFLFPGDIEKKGEETVADLPDLRADVLKIPHHASKTSSSVPFIDGVRPRFAVASLGGGNHFGFPHPGILEKYERRGVRVFRTDRDGSVSFYSDGQKIGVKTYY